MSADSSHLYTGNIPFYLHASFEDATSEVVLSAVFSVGYTDWLLFEECTPTGPHSIECTHPFYWVPVDGDSLWVLVAAFDADSNYMVDTLWVHFDSSLAVTPLVRIDDPAYDFAVVPDHELNVRGGVDNFYGGDTLYLYASVNGVVLPDYRLKEPT